MFRIRITNLIRTLFCLALAVLIASCSSAPESMRESDISFAELSGLVNKSAEKLSSLNAEGEISIDSPTLSNIGSFTVSIRKPDSLYTKIEGPFGIDIADVLITRDEFIYYNATDNKVIKGPSTQRNLGVILKMKVEFDDLVSALSGSFAITNKDTSNYSISRTDDYFVLEQNAKGSTQRYQIHAEDYYVTRIQQFDNDMKLKLEISYSDFYEYDGIFFPKKVTMKRPKEKQYVWVSYTFEDINPGMLKYRLKIPRSARIVQW